MSSSNRAGDIRTKNSSPISRRNSATGLSGTGLGLEPGTDHPDNAGPSLGHHPAQPTPGPVADNFPGIQENHPSATDLRPCAPPAPPAGAVLVTGRSPGRTPAGISPPASCPSLPARPPRTSERPLVPPRPTGRG